MAKQTKLSPRQRQQAIKPLIEDVIPEYLDGDMRTSAMDFVAHLRANKMPPRWHGLHTWMANYRGKGICSIVLRVGRGYYGRLGDLPSWLITPCLTHVHEYETLLMNGELRNLLWDNVFYCVHSGRSDSSGEGCNPNKRCAGGRNFTILGKEFKGLCGCRSLMWVWNPDETAIEGIKRLLELEQKARAET